MANHTDARVAYFDRSKRVLVIIAVVLLGAEFAWSTLHQRAVARRMHRPVDAATAISELQAGNRRFVQSARTESIDTRHDAEVRRVLAQGQHPFATIVCCSDSRICPEFIFDQPPGSLFEIRNAGNVVDDDVMASVEYAVEHIHVPLVIVMGHTKCGAIKAVHDADGQPLHDHLGAIQSHMHGLDEKVHETHDDRTQAVLDRLSNDNALLQAATLLEQCPLVRSALDAGHVRMLSMVYDIDSGEVRTLKTWP